MNGCNRAAERVKLPSLVLVSSSPEGKERRDRRRRRCEEAKGKEQVLQSSQPLACAFSVDASRNEDGRSRTLAPLLSGPNQLARAALHAQPLPSTSGRCTSAVGQTRPLPLSCRVRCCGLRCEGRADRLTSGNEIGGCLTVLDEGSGRRNRQRLSEKLCHERAGATSPQSARALTVRR